MTLGQIYESVIRLGIEKDPRGKDGVKKALTKQKKRYDKLSAAAKKEFDKENLKNPYSDTRIVHGSESTKVKGCLVGIDMDVGEVLMADRLRQMGKKIDLIISHHPAGKARAGFYEVVGMQVDMLCQRGVSVNVAEALIKERMKEVERKVFPSNFMRAADAARLLDIPFICVHTPSDNFVASYIQKLIDRNKPDTVGDIMDLLKVIPEYKHAASLNAGPKVILGAEESAAGKIEVDMTGGTEGPQKIYKKLSQAGVGTIVGMHLSEAHLKNVSKEHINVVLAGHISSDTLGMNLLLDKLAKGNKLEIISCSGFARVKRGR